MLTIIVVPTREEQVKIEAGEAPDVSNLYVREFGTNIELESYIEGLEALPDLMEYEIVRNHGLRLTIDIGGERSTIDFHSPAEKAAYLSGLEDADGFEAPAYLREGDDAFDAVKALMDARRATP